MIGNSTVVTLNLDPLTYFWLRISFYAFGAAVVAFLALVGYNLWQNHRTPMECKTLKNISLGKTPRAALLMGGDDGYYDLLGPKEMIHEGIAVTKPIAKDKSPWYGLIGRPVTVTDIEVGEGKDKDKTVALANWLLNQASRKMYLRHARIPLWLGYRGKSVLTSIMGLVALELLETLNKAMPDTFGTVDVAAIKNLFSLPWDQTQQDALGELRYKDGWKAREKWSKGTEGFKQLLMYLIVLFGIILAIAFVIKML